MMKSLLIILIFALPLCHGAPSSGCTDIKGNSIKEGHWYAPLPEAPCRECICRNGGYEEESCLDPLCAQPHCPGEPIEGQCCGWRCYSTCFDMFGVEVLHGARYQPMKGEPCYTCDCFDGKNVDCTIAGCGTRDRNCAKWEQIEGVCCGYRCVEWKVKRYFK